MSKTIIIVGLGPGAGIAAAEKFGAAGFNVALIGRNAEFLKDAIEKLRAKHVVAAGFAADATDAESLREAFRRIKAEFGNINVLLWNPLLAGSTGELLKEQTAVWTRMFNVVVIGLLAAVDEVVGDLESVEDGAVLITNGASWELEETATERLVDLAARFPKEGATSCAIGHAALHKIATLLGLQLKNKGVHVAEISFAGTVNNTESANWLGSAADPSAIVEQLWSIYQARHVHFVRVASRSNA